jgi:hypothetical protein
MYLSHGANPEQKSIHVEVQGGQILSYGPRKHLKRLKGRTYSTDAWFPMYGYLPLLPIAVNGSTLAPFPLSSDALKPVGDLVHDYCQQYQAV